ncbi:MAG: methyltransferase regulatory domain-containing protein, partial [Planctomycetaceae bacterium]
FVGIDVNPNHTASIEKDIAAGGLTNVRIVTADFKHAPDDLGAFDFVAMHGVYSWVAPEVREAAIALVQRSLGPGGLALVSYTSLPGWAHLQPIRGILRQYAALRAGDSGQKVRDALQYLVYMRDKKAQYFEDNPRAAAYVDGILKQDVRYLAHEYLNEHWTTFYFSEVAGAMRQADLSFVGSLPVFTNFWDLCVRPEFQELFRTTTDRLVTEAHKDFCANTAFRWDIYSKAPRAMASIEDRLRDTDDLHFRVARQDLKLPYQVNLGVVTSTVQGPLYEAILRQLGDKSLRLSEILAAKDLSGTSPADLARAVDAAVAMGMMDVTAGAVVKAGQLNDKSGKVRLPSRFNATMLKSESLGGRPVALASEVSGTGHSVGDFDAAILQELAENGRDGLARRVEERLAGSGRSLQQNGQPVNDPKMRGELVEGACEAFMSTSLPQLATLGIVEFS